MVGTLKIEKCKLKVDLQDLNDGFFREYGIIPIVHVKKREKEGKRGKKRRKEEKRGFILICWRSVGALWSHEAMVCNT